MLETNKKVSPAGGDLEGATKHEIIQCERCRTTFECKANAVTKCQCTQVQLTLNETQYISEQYDGCLCAGCLIRAKAEYKAMLDIKN
ncbi:MAG: cysteine-rich CWC family protein [Bacteroidetes bacterium]|nr:cysteine-rich CWC family protein [Bacteroidota bacterium]